jgi:hypothetical protein
VAAVLKRDRELTGDLEGVAFDLREQPVSCPVVHRSEIARSRWVQQNLTVDQGPRTSCGPVDRAENQPGPAVLRAPVQAGLDRAA